MSGQSDVARARPWRSAVARIALAAFPLWCTASVIVLWTAWRHKLIVGSIAALTLASPDAGLVAIALVAPLGTVIEQVTALPYRLSEAIVLAFLGSWLLRASTDRRGPGLPPPVTVAAWLLAAAALVSVGLSAWRAHGPADQLHDFDFAIWIRQAYYVMVDPFGFVDAARLIEGLGLAAAAIFLFRNSPSMAESVPLAIAVGGALAAGAAVSVWRGVGPRPLVAHFTQFGYRTAHLTDVNAAASFFALVVCLALGMTLRARGRARPMWVALAAASLVGLWFANSRTAALALAVSFASLGAWYVAARANRRGRIALLAALAAIAIVLALRARDLERGGFFWGAGFRSQFNETSFRMIAARPLGGIGIGQYFRLSPLFLTPELSWSYGHENAHNYFLQITAELGIPGGILFLTIVSAGLVAIGRSVAVSFDPRLLGAMAGLLAFLISSLTGHPFLVDEAAIPFWIVFGVAVGLAESARVSARSAPEARTPRRAAMVAVAGIAACLIAAGHVAEAVRGPVEPHASADGLDGFYPWESDADGRRYHWTSQFASVFVPADVRRVAMPVRIGAVPTISPIGLEIRVGATPRPRVFVGADWAVVDIDVSRSEAALGFKRIDLRADRAWQPAIYVPGSADMRVVGVQVGPWKRIE